MKEKVALICKNGNGFVEALLDIWEAENIAVLIDILSSVKSIEKIILEEKITEAYVDSQNEVIILALKNLNIKIIKINVEDIMYEELQESSYLKFHSRYADYTEVETMPKISNKSKNNQPYCQKLSA